MAADAARRLADIEDLLALPDGYLTALVAKRGERVRAEPFDALELAVGLLFGDDPEDVH